MKELIINGSVFAKYSIGYKEAKEMSNTLFLHPIINIFADNIDLSEI